MEFYIVIVISILLLFRVAHLEVRALWNGNEKSVAPYGEDVRTIYLPQGQGKNVPINCTVCVPAQETRHDDADEEEQSEPLDTRNRNKSKSNHVLLKFVYIKTIGSAGTNDANDAADGAGDDAGNADAEGNDANPSLSGGSHLHPVREEVVVKVEVPVKEGLLKLHKKKDKPQKFVESQGYFCVIIICDYWLSSCHDYQPAYSWYQR